jgi:hypothetical protein
MSSGSTWHATSARSRASRSRDDFNKHGRKGWEFVAVAEGYAIFKRRRPVAAD